MPPRGGHSSSSHSSSRSRSSSSRSHSHSSSSRSHSSSSHSSYSRSSYSGSSGSSQRSSYRSASQRPARTRYNQPSGYRYHSTHRTTTYYCRKHDYTYYPVDWTDEATGRVFQKGYYDEAGNRYEQLILKHNSMYENVPLRCDYCGTRIVRDLTDDTQTMSCPNCSAGMVMEAILDDQDPNGPGAYGSAEGSGNYSTVRRPSSTFKKVMILVLLLFFGGPILVCCSQIGLIFVNTFQRTLYQNIHPGSVTPSANVATVTPIPLNVPKTNPEIFGKTIYLKSGANGYEYTSSSDAEKTLKWQAADDCFYEPVSDCYLWYNTDVEPALWQYWYEGISSDYGDYGWMEYEEGKWYVEAGENNWILLPDSKYDMSKVWHFSDPSDISYFEK